MQPWVIPQLSRILGADEVTPLGLTPGTEATPEQLAALGRLIDRRIDQFAIAMLEEAAASDDVIDPASANAYLEDRLNFFSDVLTPGQREAIRESFARQVEHWT